LRTDAKENLITAIQIAFCKKMGCRYYWGVPLFWI
jgi:hypothetical protein